MNFVQLLRLLAVTAPLAMAAAITGVQANQPGNHRRRNQVQQSNTPGPNEIVHAVPPYLKEIFNNDALADNPFPIYNNANINDEGEKEFELTMQ